MYIEKDEAGPVPDVLAYKIFDEVTLANPAEANDGKMRRTQLFSENHGLSLFCPGRNPQQQVLPIGCGLSSPIQVTKYIAYVGKHI